MGSGGIVWGSGPQGEVCRAILPWGMGEFCGEGARRAFPQCSSLLCGNGGIVGEWQCVGTGELCGAVGYRVR